MSSANVDTKVMPAVTEPYRTVDVTYPRQRPQVKTPITDQILVSVYKGIGWATGVLFTMLLTVAAAGLFVLFIGGQS